MNLSKLLFTTSIILGIGFTGCSNDDDTLSSDGSEKANTNVSVTLKMGQNSGTKTTKSTSEELRNIGSWAGKDKIETVAIYLVDGSTVSANYFTVGSDASAEYIQETNSTTKEVSLRPVKAIRTTSGIKKVYVLINGTEDIIKTLGTSSANDFENAYRNVALALGNSGADSFTGTSADKLVKKNGSESETIVMTNVADVTINVAPNVTEAQALQTVNPLNRASVSVERTVARVMVTTDLDSYDIKFGSDILGSISDIHWVLAQGESSLYLQRKADWATPNYGWIPTTYEQFINTKFASKDAKYDYSGLLENYDSAKKFGGTVVPTMLDYEKDPTKQVTDELNAKLSGKFILPNTHAYGNESASSYRKGNTAYVLIRAKFTPKSFADREAYEKGKDFYVGANGKFYTSAENAVDPSKGGISGQTVAKYVGGKVLYYAWVNPDAVPNWYNSPVIRNSIYHVHITGFKNLGTNWNPLFPEDPNSTSPKNPDPKPKVTGVTEPENPIDPTDLLTTPETWMNVDVKVLPWTLYSYKVDLGI